jgi:dihydrolipoamide dehydrogenase
VSRSYDVAIIGAGTAGLSALSMVRKRTESFVLINDGAYGTTCARVGCMPSKALIEVAKLLHRRGLLREMGIAGGEALRADVPEVLRHVRRVRDSFVQGVLKLTADLGERNLSGRARLAGPGAIEVAGERIEAGRIIIATGSRPVVPEPWRALGDRLLTTDELFEQSDLPRRIAVVGLGAVGAEMAQALARLGLQVSGLDAAQRIAGLADAQVNAVALELLRREFAIRLGAPVELTAEGGGVRVAAAGEQIVVDKVLVALGRVPNHHGLGLETLGVKLDKRGLPPFDPRTMQIANLPVYIAGDANARAPILHEAADEGWIAAHNALRDAPACFERRVPLGIVFTDPNLATVGARADELDDKAAVGEARLNGQGRLRMSDEDRGLIRVYADKASGRLLGAALCAPRGEHLAHLLALAVQRGLTVHEVLRMPFYHPVVEEALRSALRDLARQLTLEPESDLAACTSFGAGALD